MGTRSANVAKLQTTLSIHLSKCAYGTADGHDVGLLYVRRTAVMPVLLRVLRKLETPIGHHAELNSAW